MKMFRVLKILSIASNSRDFFISNPNRVIMRFVGTEVCHLRDVCNN
jgi:hypothetical protein